MIGRGRRNHTGWVSSEGADRALYSPHTKAGYRLPPSKALYTLGCAVLATRMRAARKAGLAS